MKNPKKDVFSGRKIIIATKHHKEKVIAPLLEKELGLHCIIPENFDSDRLGTFTGEVERSLDPISTVRAKCTMAMEEYNADLAIANEGSFGPDPLLFFVPSDEEIIMLCDARNNLEIMERELSNETNFQGTEIHSQKELIAFASSVQFPAHGIIMRKNKDDPSKIVKGITDWEHLILTFNSFIKDFGSVYLETDMRAMYNPTRMKIIGKAAETLIKKIKSLCPNCQTPGFGVTSIRQGLPCQLCEYPTRSVLSHIYTCSKCAFSKEIKYPHNKMTEDPMYCDRCNP